MRPFASFYIGNIQSSLNTPVNTSLPQTISFAKFRNNRFLDETLAAGQFHIHPHLEIFYFESREGYFETSTVKENLVPHDLLIVNANNPHRQFSDNQPPLVYYCLSITNLVLDDLPANSISKNVYELIHHTSSNNLPHKIVKGILRELENLNSSGGFFKIQSLIYDLLSYILKTLSPTVKKESKTIKHTEKDIILQEVQKYLIEHFTEQITLADLEKIFFISKSLLCHYFKDKYGISPIEYLIRFRIEHAKTLLFKTDLSVSDISARSGFSNSNYFSFLFKKYVEKSPIEYRNYSRSTPSDSKK